MLEGTGFDTKIDKERLLKIKKHFAEDSPSLQGIPLEHHRRGNGDLQKPDSRRHALQHGKPAESSRRRTTGLEEVLAEVPRVRKDSGFPPLVTPTSQIVGTQAVFNVLMGKYKVMTGEFADLMLGYYGETIGRAIRK